MINVLDQSTINKIAAGEVVERPSSVVKELVENAIDAGASAITVEIKEGGISFIRITDNGTGIPKEDVKKAFVRHATSKIETIEDLLGVASLGFRGEALASIAAVSQVNLITKTANDITGISYEIHGSLEISCEEIGAPTGTTIVVRNLFYNVPARKKFLKTATTEGGYITDLITRLALSHPDISFKYIINGSNKIATSGNGNLKDVIYHIYGKEVAANLIPVEHTEGDMSVKGFVGKAFISKGNRSFEHYFINGRAIKNSLVTKAIEEGYKSFVMIHRFPFTALHFTLDGNKLDVNVHPTKMEFKYSEGEQLFDFVKNVVRQALLSEEMIKDMSLLSEKEEKKIFETEQKKLTEHAPEPFENNKRLETYQKAFAKASIKETTISSDVKQETLQLSFEEERFISYEARKKHRLIGQVFKTYWMIEYEGSLYIIDQHAAHEKVMFERLMKKVSEKQVITQQIFPPKVVHLSGSESSAIIKNIDLFKQTGFDIEDFGDDSIVIRGVPDDIMGIDPILLFDGLAKALESGLSNLSVDFFVEKLSGMACKAAIKGNTEISFAEADALIDELLTLDNPYNCPHGRPTTISLTKAEIEKKFKRIQDKDSKDYD